MAIEGKEWLTGSLVNTGRGAEPAYVFVAGASQDGGSDQKRSATTKAYSTGGSASEAVRPNNELFSRLNAAWTAADVASVARGDKITWMIIPLVLVKVIYHQLFHSTPFFSEGSEPCNDSSAPVARVSTWADLVVKQYAVFIRRPVLVFGCQWVSGTMNNFIFLFTQDHLPSIATVAQVSWVKI